MRLVCQTCENSIAERRAASNDLWLTRGTDMGQSGSQHALRIAKVRARFIGPTTSGAPKSLRTSRVNGMEQLGLPCRYVAGQTLDRCIGWKSEGLTNNWAH